MRLQGCPLSQELNLLPAYHAIAQHDGPLYNLHDPSIQTTACLVQENLQELSEKCEWLKSNVDTAPMLFCPLKRRE